MDKESGSRNREATEQALLNAVDELIGREGFEQLGINAVAARAGVSKILIYRYFGSLDGLIAAYIARHDVWITFSDPLPATRDGVIPFVRDLFRRQIGLLRDNYTLRRLYRWELSSDNPQVQALREQREATGLRLVEGISRLTGIPRAEMAAFATLLSSAVTYLALLAENCPAYNDIPLRTDEGWEQLEQGIDTLIEQVLKTNPQ